jgi:non-ribosomal peptide synthetase-like protein
VTVETALPSAVEGMALPDLFLASALRWPDACALDLPPSSDRPRRRVSYSELRAQAEAIAGLGLRGVVAILLPRTTERLCAAQLGVLRGGAAHVAVDPAFPDGQLREILTDCEPSAVLTDAVGGQRLRALGFRGNVVRLDRPLPVPEALPPPPGPDDLAYLIYTSGTTGRPKGVMIAHRGIASLVRSDVREFGLGPGDRVAQGSSSAYDSSVEESWMALASGATSVVLDDEAARLGPDLVPWLRDERITVLCPPPTLLRAADCADPAAELPELRLLYVGGEALPSDVADRWARGRRMVNGYGPTECTVTCLRHEIVPGEPVAIGRPVPGVRAWVLNSELEPVFPGEKGELCLSGDGLALGYLNEPAKTAASFPDHPQLGRLYRTGDLVHCEPDGTFFSHGRIDSQVKVRGYRIELEAVEACLARCAGVREAAVRVQGEGAAQLLAAHVVPVDDEIPPADVLAAHLSEQLPSYMVPSRFGLLSALPRGTSGKVRRQDLPELAGTSRAERSGQVPAEGVAARIAASVRTVLGTSAVGMDDDFFTDLGGSSLLAAMLISRLRVDPDTSGLAVRDIYSGRTVRELARRAEQHRPEPEPVEKPETDDAGPVWPATAKQTAWLAVELLGGSALAYVLFFLLMPWISNAVGFVPLVVVAPVLLWLVRPVFAPVGVLLAVGAKKLLIGRYRMEEVPAWSSRAVRMWMVRQVARLVPWQALAGTEFQSSVLRMLGARVGERVHIHRGVNLMRGGWDLLDIGDDVTLSQDSAVRLVHLERGRMVVGPVLLADGATLDVRAGVAGNTRVGRNSWLGALSSLPGGAEVPDGVLADGVPARNQGAVADPPPITSGAKQFSPRAHGALVVLAQALLQSALALPYSAALAALLSGSYGLNYDTLLSALGNPSGQFPLLAEIAGLSLSGLVLNVVLQGLLARALGPVRPGVISRWGLAYIRVWLKTGLVTSAGNWLSGSLMWPRWLRLAGMRVGRDCEVSTIIDVVPELVGIGSRTFLADGIYLGGPRVHRGTVQLGRLQLGEDTFVGNHAVLPGDRAMSDDLLIGIATPADRDFPPGSSWFGHPSFELPRREIVEADRSLTHEPALIRRVNRWIWELARFALPLVPMAALEGWTYGAQEVRTEPEGLLYPVLLPAISLACAAALGGTALAVKWLLLGRVRPGSHPLWSCWCSRWDFLYVAWRLIAMPALTPLEGTLLLPLYLRRTGMRIGKRALLGEGSAQVVDPDMIDVGDGATVSALFQAHTFEDRVLKIDRVRVGERASVEDDAVPLYGADIGAGAVVAPHSVVMKQEHLPAGRRYEGAPVSA